MPSMASRGRGRRTMNEINMVPFIDVMLVLLIIFMVTAPMVTPSLIDLPSVGKAGRQPDKVIQVVINKDERLEIKGADGSQTVTQRELAAAVKRAQGDDTAAPVVISADRNVKYETVVKAMDTLQRAGIARVGLSVQLGP
ncbi:protein TolR [Pseudorhodoferax sp. Leaf267]|uniref:protein TolR n=1 Tax=Pseudorhodoferax sp. Leaf267 TaxID=1736316 RepID=UPI0007017BF9|nr:protein TolR [Pseudorhodoferax sp. Leaf267]KQP14351.1 protein TolR [Pseudorhodoferax sp. Leaf267]